MDCLFCKIATKQLPCKLLFEDDQLLAFEDIHPQAPTHLLIVPKQHVEGVYDVTAAHGPLLAHLLLTARKLAESQGLAEQGYRLVLNNKAHGGQTVNHLHMHLLGGRQMAWPPG